MRKSLVYPTEVETENHLLRRTVKGASFHNRKAKLKKRLSNLSNQSGNQDNHSNYLIPLDVKTSSSPSNRGTWVVDIKDEKRGHWITEHFQKKECIRYVQDSLKSGQQPRCFCGRTKDQHISVALTSPGRPSKTWNPNTDFERSPTDAYGKIAFFPCRSGREKPAKYVRLTEDTDPQDIMKLLFHHWRLPRPKLVISVTGGAKNFKLDSQDQETFNRGLIRASQATGAWILTGGTNIGVNKSVGIAVREGQSMKWVQRKAEQAVNCIGIAPWGYIENTDRLVGKNGQGLYPALYNVNPVVTRGKPCPLNPDHTHFLLVDNGMKNKFGADLLLRPKIEEAIAAPKSELGQGIPVVLVLLEGGTDAIMTTKNAILRGIPTVVCEGTGRAADIIAYAHNHAVSEDGVHQLTFSSIQKLKEKITAAYDVDPDSPKMEALLQDVGTCIHQEHLITVFEMDKGENSDLDLAILQALLKGQLASPVQQLSLALSWNRVDVAETKILTDETVWPNGSLDPFITSALVHNHVEFLRLFLEHGAIMEEYLTVARLRRLYNAADADDHLRMMLSKITKNKPHLPIYLHDIGDLLHNLTGSHNDPMYRMDKRVKCVGRGSLALMVLSTSLSGTNLVQKAQEEFVKSEGRDFTTGSQTLSMMELANPGLHFEQPFRELFLWAVLMNRMEMAEFFWERGDNPVSTAIAASQIMYKLSKQTTDMDLMHTYKNNARKFESLATSVIEECYQTDEEFAGMLIDCPHAHWQGRNTLTIAASARDQDFISHPCCRNVVQGIWLGGLASTHWCLIPLAIFVPSMIFVLNYKPLMQKNRMRLPHWYEKIGIFYKAPVTKFWGFLISYILFLLLYSYVLLFRFQRQPNLLQYVVFGWIATMILEEIREIVPEPHTNQTFFKKFKKWVRSGWNILDFFMLSFAIIGFTLHMSPKTYGWARTLYAANGCLFFVRLLRTFAVSDSLGPKMVMIKRMMMEMLIFLCIFVIFLVGYGVATQALLYPNQTLSWKAIRSIFYMPYFQIYGELFLDVIVKGECDIDTNAECPTKHPVVAIMLGIYLLIGNVLLLNLLIAIFSHIFDDVQTNSLKIWKYEYYLLITEIEARPILPPPLVVIEHMLRICYWLYRVVAGGCISANKTCEKYTESDLRQLHIFEKECAATYRHKKAEKGRTEVPESISRIEKRLEELSKHIESCPANQHQKAPSSPKLSPAESRRNSSPIPPNYLEQQQITPSNPQVPPLWGNGNRLPPIQESPVIDGTYPFLDEQDEDTDNVIIDHKAIPHNVDGRDRIPPDGKSVITERPYRRRSSKSSRKSSKSPRKSSMSPKQKTPKSKSSTQHSDRESIGTEVSLASHGSKYSNDPMSDFRLKLLLDSPNEHQQEVTGQRSKVDEHEVAGSSSQRSKVGDKNDSSSSSSSSGESPRKHNNNIDKKMGNDGNQSKIIMLETRMNQLEQSSVEATNALQRIEQLLQLVVESKQTSDQ